MPSYTTSLRLVQPATGEYSGTWGTEVNNGLTALVDASIAGTSSITMTAANFTLTTANGASDQSRAMFLVLGGTPGASFAVIVPSVSKLYFVTNNTGFAQTVRTSGTGISVPNGASMTLRCDGTNVVVAENYFASLTLGSALPVASGGTGLTSYTSGGVVYASSTSALATGSGLTFNGTGLGVGIASALGNLDVYTAATSIGYVRTANQTLKLTADDAGNRVDIANVAGNPLSFTIGVTERMRLDASGNLGIGTTSPGARLDVQAAAAELRTLSTTGTNTVRNYQSNTGGQFYQGIDSSTGANFGTAYAAVLWHTGNYPMVFATNNTERARITSGGEVYIAGTTDQGAYNLQVNGTGVWGAGAYVNGSDERLKEDITTIDAALDVVNMLRPVTFRYKETHSKDQSIQPGFIAQELQIAMAGKAYVDGVVHSGPEYLNVAYQSLIPLLTKAIQEQQALIASLTARVAALEQA